MLMSSDTPTFAGKARATLGAILMEVLREESQLAASLHRYAWRVRGSPLLSIKRLFAEQERQIDRWVTELGSRAQGIGLAALTPAAEGPEGEAPASPRAIVAELLARHEAIIRELRSAVAAVAERDPDGDTATVLNGLLEFHETSAWMLRLLLESPERARVV